jgi:hypothetical protein
MKMIHQTLNRITMVGFMLIFVSTLGSLVTLVMPLFDAIDAPILQFIMLPAFAIGVALIIFEKMQTASDY